MNSMTKSSDLSYVSNLKYLCFFFSNFTKIEYTRRKLVYTRQKRFRLVTRVNKKDYKNQFGPTSFVECQVNEGTSYKSICQE